MNGKDLLSVLLMVVPTIALVAAVVLGLLLTKSAAPAQAAQPAAAKFAAAGETARCNSSESRERACY